MILRILLLIALIVYCYINWPRIMTFITEKRMVLRHRLTMIKAERIKFLYWLGFK